MHRLYWFIAGIIAGIFLYRYFRDEGGQVPGFESLGEGGRRLTERGRDFAESGRQFVESGRQLADEGHQFAHAAADTAQSRSREVIDTVKAQASRFSGESRMREDVSQGPTGPA